MLRRLALAALLALATVFVGDVASFAAEGPLCGTQEQPCVVRAVQGYESAGLLAVGVGLVVGVAYLVSYWGQGD